MVTKQEHYEIRASRIASLNQEAQATRFERKGLKTDLIEIGGEEVITFECQGCGEMLPADGFPMTRLGNIGYTCRTCRAKKKTATGRRNRAAEQRILRRQMEMNNGTAKTDEEVLAEALRMRGDGWSATDIALISAALAWIESRSKEILS